MIAKRMMSMTCLISTLIITLMATDAFASRARVSVLGSGDNGGIVNGRGHGGSLFYDDAYNMFYNPVYINDHKDWATIEKSNFSATGVGTTAQGGFVTSMADFAVGLYMNRVGGIISQTNRNLMRPIDLIIGGDMGMKWGFGLTYGSFKNGPSDQDLVLRAGVNMMGFEPFLTAKVLGKDRTSGSDLTHHHYSAGFRYRYGEWTPYLAYRQDRTASNNVNNSFGAGIARNSEVAEGVMLNYAVGYWKETVSGQQRVPLDVSVEGKAVSWLTLRGGITFDVMNQTQKVSATTDPTSGRIGAGFHVGPVDFDFAVGSNAGANAQTEVATDTTSQTFDIANGFFSQAALTYNW